MDGSLHAHGSGFEQTWRTLGEIKLDCTDSLAPQLTQTQVRAALEACVPVAMTGEDLRSEIEAALLATLARIETGTGQGKTPRPVDENLDATSSGANKVYTQSACVRIMVVAAHTQEDTQSNAVAPLRDQRLGWSFFVIERPTITNSDSTACCKIIDLCLYHD